MSSDIGDFAGKMILGTWALGGRNWGSYSLPDAVEALKAAFDAGVRGIDTSPVYGYGHAEELIRAVLGGSRKSLFIATKGGLNREAFFAKDLSPSFLEKELHGSLRRLGTDYIDLYQCHWPDEKTPVAETMEALTRFRREGKIRHIGLCNFPPEKIEEALACGEIYAIQERLSLLEQDRRRDALLLASERGLRGFVYGVLEGGLLTGKYTAPPSFGKKDVRSYFYRHFRDSEWPGVAGLLSVLKEIAEVHNTVPGNVALAWALAVPGVTSLIVGARSAEQVRGNLGALNLSLSSEERQRLEKATGFSTG